MSVSGPVNKHGGACAWEGRGTGHFGQRDRTSCCGDEGAGGEGAGGEGESGEGESGAEGIRTKGE